MNKLSNIILFLCLIGPTVFAQVNLSNGLMAYYPFTGTFNDASGTGNHGTGMNGVTFGTDQWGNANNAAFFDGANDWISVPASASITPGHLLSIAFRFKTTSSALQVLLSKSEYTGGSAPNNLQYQVGINGGSVLPSNGLFFASSHTNTCLTSNFLATNYSYGTSTSNGQWYCVVITFNNGVKKVYMNGSLISTLTVSGTNNNTSIDSCTGGTLRIGTWWQNDTRFFSGLMDELRIWNRTINQQEIDSLCNVVIQNPDTIINKYAAITSRDYCDNSFTVDTATDFAAGDTVLMIQMKGATVDTGNSNSFGNILANNGAGNYEYNVVSAVSGNRISLRYKVQRAYDIPNGRVQFVRVPSYVNYTVSQPHTCLPWTGTKGGIFAIRVAGALTMNKAIDVSGKGFRGGQINNATTFSCDQTDYYYPLSGNDGGMKGEGIAEVSTLRIRGKGKLANGGGGGNNTNAGGGGGSNAGSGGNGGRQLINCNTTLPEGGVGGAALPYSAANNRLYAGGGGGCGHENNADTDPGGNGGGIIIINAGTLAGNGSFIRANGAHCVDNKALNAAAAGGDGQSGGGAGGTVLLRVNNFSSAPSVEAKGGNGGNVYSATVNGPGGGGGGGAVLFSNATLNAGNINTAGGSNGKVIPAGNAAHSSLPGQGGLALSAIPYVFPSSAFQPNIFNINFTDTVISCLGRQMISMASTTTTGIAGYDWSYGNLTSDLQHPVFVFPGIGAHSVKLIVTDSNGCRDSLVKDVLINFPRFANAGADTSICPDGSAVLTASGGVRYAWLPATDLSDPLMPVTTARPKQATTYIVTVTDSSGCTDRDTVEVAIWPAPIVDAYSEGDAISCSNSAVQLYGRGALSYTWSPGMYCNDSTIASPIVSPVRTTLFTLTGTDERGCSSSDTITVLSAKDVVVFIPDAFTPNGDGRNDLFRPIAYCDFSLSEFRIFNRWGQLVYYGYADKHAWDGTHKGRQAELGVYFYFIRGIKKSTGEEVLYKGNITLVR